MENYFKLIVNHVWLFILKVLQLYLFTCLFATYHVPGLLLLNCHEVNSGETYVVPNVYIGSKAALFHIKQHNDILLADCHET